MIAWPAEKLVPDNEANCGGPASRKVGSECAILGGMDPNFRPDLRWNVGPAMFERPRP